MNELHRQGHEREFLPGRWVVHHRVARRWPWLHEAGWLLAWFVLATAACVLIVLMV